MPTKTLEGGLEPQQSELQQANDSSSPSGHLSEVLANRRALGLSNRIPCLTPYVEPLPESGPAGESLPGDGWSGRT